LPLPPLLYSSPSWRRSCWFPRWPFIANGQQPPGLVNGEVPWAKVVGAGSSKTPLALAGLKIVPHYCRWCAWCNL
jgi:hypothetical protein